MIATGGKTVYGASVGILMLDARFPRIPGDMGNALTWPFPVMYKVVRGASPDHVVRRKADGLVDVFIEAARDLVKDGVDGITTNCGFLSLVQAELSRAVPVPIITSSLHQVVSVNRLMPACKRAGILTISGSTLTQAHLDAADVPQGTPIGTTEGLGVFTRTILDDELTMDVAAARKENVQAALAMKEACPELGGIVLECTNMCPYAPDIASATGLPVWSMVSLVEWFQSGLVPRRFPAP